MEKSPSMAAPMSLYLLLPALFLQTHLYVSAADPELNLIRPFTSVEDVHDLLPAYGFPKGLLPNNVKSYTLTDDGHFSVELYNPCYVQFDQLVYYDKQIKAKLSYGSVHGVSGIQAKKLFLWVSVTGIEVDKTSDMIEFYVGALSEKLPAKNFQVIPACKSKASRLTRLDSV